MTPSFAYDVEQICDGGGVCELEGHRRQPSAKEAFFARGQARVVLLEQLLLPLLTRPPAATSQSRRGNPRTHN